MWPAFWSRLAVGVPAACLFLLGFAHAYPAVARRYQREIDELDALAAAEG